MRLAQDINLTPPVGCLHSQHNLAVTISLLLILPGCASSTESEVEMPVEPDCASDPNADGCFENVITEEDCSSKQVFTGYLCRTMMRPEMLDFGESEVTLEIGVEIQQMTPSFLGDAPSSWAVNPPLPDGIVLDSDSGVISGTPTQESSRKSYTIIASNAMGVSSFRLQIIVRTPEINSI